MASLSVAIVWSIHLNLENDEQSLISYWNLEASCGVNN